MFKNIFLAKEVRLEFPYWDMEFSQFIGTYLDINFRYPEVEVNWPGMEPEAAEVTADLFMTADAKQVMNLMGIEIDEMKINADPRKFMEEIMMKWQMEMPYMKFE